MFSHYLDKITKATAVLCGLLLAVLMLFLLADIAFRTAGHPLIGVAELSMFIMLTTVYLGLANCEMLDGHVKVEFLTDKLGPKAKRIMAIFVGILSVITMAICTYAMINNAIDSYVEDEAMAGLIPYQVWPVKGIMAFGIGLYFLQVCVRLYRNIKGIPGSSK